MKKVRMIIEFGVDEQAAEEKGITAEEVVDNITLHNHDTIDGFEIFPAIDGCDLCSDFFLHNAKVVSKTVIDNGEASSAGTITKEMVAAGYQKGIIKLCKSPHDDGVVCKIGDHWFYFGGLTAEESTVEDYKRYVPEEDIVNEILAALNDFRASGEDFMDEYLYYKCYLEEHLTDNCDDFGSSTTNAPGAQAKNVIDENPDRRAILIHLNNLMHELDGAVIHDPCAVPAIEAAICNALSNLEELQGSPASSDDAENEANTQELVNKAKAALANTPNGVIRDADTILYDLIEEADFEITGIAECILRVWEKAFDKKAVEEMFYIFTDMHFEDFLKKVIEETTQEG